MQNIPNPLRPAQTELQQTAHDQDLIEIPKRARLDREAEGRRFSVPTPASPGQVITKP
jgi:hypothetical protein